jgi:hypothetical protein
MGLCSPGVVELKLNCLSPLTHATVAAGAGQGGAGHSLGGRRRRGPSGSYMYNKLGLSRLVTLALHLFVPLCKARPSSSRRAALRDGVLEERVGPRVRAVRARQPEAMQPLRVVHRVSRIVAATAAAADATGALIVVRLPKHNVARALRWHTHAQKHTRRHTRAGTHAQAHIRR